MTEYKTFDDCVRNVFKIEPREITHISPEEQKKKILKITADELINIWNELTELEAENEQIKNSETLCKLIGEQKIKIVELEAQIEKMKADVRVNIKLADQSNNCLMYQKLNSMLNQWEGKRR